tara:strand:+ start:4511 stop:4897 length:387 start_codon:yes stop_codon:yes gene_type:complete
MYQENLINQSQTLEEIIFKPSIFIQEKFNIVLTDAEIYIIFFISVIFFTGLLFEIVKPKSTINDDLLPQGTDNKGEISSNSNLQKIDLAYAYVSMGKKALAEKILNKLKKENLSKKELREINKLKKKF